MPITYPLDTPTTIGIGAIDIRAVNAVSTTQSPFTYKQQVFNFGGQRWEASVSLPSQKRDLMAAWKAFLTALKGQTGTFLLGDPDYVSPRGDVSSCVVSGSAGDESVSVVMTGSLLAGDYIQLGSGSAAKLHQVLTDQTGDGGLDIWPALRSDYVSEVAIFNSPKGVFRLTDNITSWSINNINSYGISFDAVEVLS